jgi:ribosome biogenesis GTPase
MKKLTKQQKQKIQYEIRDKLNRDVKKEMIHGKLPKFLSTHVPYIRKIAPKLDQILIVASFVTPPLKTGMVDRFLVLSELEEIEPVICFNKVDLAQDKHIIEKQKNIYAEIGYKVIITSAKTGHNTDLLKKVLAGKRTALAGHSGVGKSSLINYIAPHLDLEVGKVSETTNKGVHTTTRIRVFKILDDAEIIDLPGIKLLDFIDIHRDEARFYFREFQQYAENCKFRNCLHLVEKNCAVQKALQEGKIAYSRYESYKNILESLQ